LLVWPYRQGRLSRMHVISRGDCHFYPPSPSRGDEPNVWRGPYLAIFGLLFPHKNEKKHTS
jgi:hypothetical protein